MRFAASSSFLLALGLALSKAAEEGVPVDEIPFDHTVTVRFAGEPEFPATIIIRGAYLGPIFRSFLVPDETPLSIHCRLPAGDYQIESVLPGLSTRYWDDPIRLDKGRSAAAHFAVRPGGELNNVLGLPHEFFHRFKIEIIGPKQDFVAGKKPPLLSWKPVEGATQYRVYWTESKAPEKRSDRDGSLEVPTPFLDFDLELTPGARYEWQIDAYDKEMRSIGYSGPSQFYADEQARQAFLHSPERPDRGGYLGVMIGETDHPLPGIRVSQVLPGTPAALAGLQPGDVITRFAGIPLADMSVMAFIALARSQPPETTVPIEFARGFSDPQIFPATIHMGIRTDVPN